MNSQTLPNTLGPFMWKYLKHKKLHLAGFVLVGVVWAIEMSLSPFLLKIIIDTVVAYSSNHILLAKFILLPAIWYVALTFIVNLNFRFYDYVSLRLYTYIKGAVNEDMISYLLHHSHNFFQNTFTGSLTKKLSDMMDNIEPLINIPNEWFYPRILAMIFASITLCYVVQPIFGLILFIWAVIYVFVTYKAAKGSEKFARMFSESAAKLSGTTSDSIANIMTTKLFANISHEISHIRHDIATVVKNDRELLWYNLKVNFLQGIGISIFVAAMLSGLIYGAIHGWINAGDFALVVTLSTSFMWGVHDVGKQMQRFFKAVGTCNQALSFIKIPHEIIDSSDAKPLVVSKGEIKFENIDFSYSNNNALFKNLNVTINPGEKVGLVGYSGAGKSTFIKLILRLIDTQAGNIYIDGQPIKKVTKNSLRKMLGTIPQDPDLFHRSLMENIRFARTDAGDDEVIEAAKKAHLHEFICELPEQYQSLVGEKGVKLSGGQKQRIAIARAFLKNAPILLLDEATSSLDSVTERYIQECLHNVMQNKTTIVIAHRLSTLKDMDRILVFVNGEIVEDGTLSSLLENKSGHFYKLWNMQAEGFIPSIK